MRLLIIGTLDGYMSAAAKIAVSQGAKVLHTETIDEALEVLRNGNGADLIFLDVREKTSVLIEALTREHISVPVITCGINVGSKQAALSIKEGASDYIPLPPDPELIAAILSAVSEESTDVIYADHAMEGVLALAKKIAPSTATVLITGESGTGKEVIANYIHRHSARAKEKFISVNCAAIPENLLESELFGHEKGAFTGAIARRIGKFEEATKGTLLLDEISEMAPHLQAKLLRAIQEQEIDRVGGNRPVKVDIRLIATSNRNLEEAVKEGAFREDLYFRLNVINLHLPPLRTRPLDIKKLAEHFVEKYSKANKIDAKPISPEAIQVLQQHNWPGNVRELENAVHRAVLLSAGDSFIEKESVLLPNAKKEQQAQAHMDLETTLVGRTVSDVEKELILGTLNHCLGNRTHAANILGISIRTLRNKLKQYTDEGVQASAIRREPEFFYKRAE